MATLSAELTWAILKLVFSPRWGMGSWKLEISDTLSFLSASDPGSLCSLCSVLFQSLASWLASQSASFYRQASTFFRPVWCQCSDIYRFTKQIGPKVAKMAKCSGVSYFYKLNNWKNGKGSSTSSNQRLNNVSKKCVE